MTDGGEQQPENDELPGAKRELTYRRLAEITDTESVHELVTKRGESILDRSIPYLVVAARNAGRDLLRRQRETLVAEPRVEAGEPRPFEPGGQFELSDLQESLRKALARLDDRDLLIVWRSAEGFNDKEIQEEWDARQYQPRNPGLGLIRKRRERARARLRKEI